MTRLLLTNDDGIDSPALVPFARSLERLGEVTVVVPDHERSWVGKAVTRYGDVTLQEVERGGLRMHETSGYPADAAQLGIHVVTDPDVVVSGINLGENHGAAFLLSSGTVGAAMEAWIAGRVGVAFSTSARGEYAAWRDWAVTPAAAPAWVRLAHVCVGLLDEILAAGLPAHADVISVNLPFDATLATPRVVTDVARVGYGRLFRPAGPGRYRHEFADLTERGGSLVGTDVGVAADGGVSITPVRLPRGGDVPDALRRRLEATPATTD